MRNIIINLQKCDTWKTHLTIVIDFIFSKDVEVECAMHSKSDNIKFTPYNDANEVVREILDSLRSNYQENLETSMRRSNFIFDSVQLMYFKCHKVNCKRGGSYIDSPDQKKKKKATINPKNTDDKSVAFDYEESEWNPEITSNIPLITKYNWKGINYPSK